MILRLLDVVRLGKWSKNKIDENGVDIQRKLKIRRHVLSSSTWPQIWSFHVVVKTTTAKKCIKM